MLISSRNSLIETSRNKVLPSLSASLSSIKLTQKKLSIIETEEKKGHHNVTLKNLEINLGVLHLKF